jgi:hypothetical protein
MDFVAIVNRARHSMLMLDNIVMMDKTIASYHTPQTKRRSSQEEPARLYKGQGGS